MKSKLPPIDWDAILLKKGIDWDDMSIRICFIIIIPILLPFTFIPIIYQYIKQRRIWNNGVCPANGIPWTQMPDEIETPFGGAWFEAGKHAYWFDFPSMTGVISEFYMIPRKVEYPPPRVIQRPPKPYRNTL